MCSLIGEDRLLFGADPAVKRPKRLVDAPVDLLAPLG
jgi:hypothetical protein